MPWQFLGKWTNSNNHSAVTDRCFAVQICQGCRVDPKKKNLYWAAGIVDITPKVILIPVLNSILNGDWRNSVRVRQFLKGPMLNSDTQFKRP